MSGTGGPLPSMPPLSGEAPSARDIVIVPLSADLAQRGAVAAAAIAAMKARQRDSGHGR